MVPRCQTISEHAKTGGCIAALLLLMFFLSPAPGSAAPAASGHLQSGSAKTGFSRIADMVRTEIRKGRIPGAVVLVGTRDRILYRQAFGNRSLTPERRMTADTLFDLASLTKVIATTTAVMQLIEKKTLALDSPVAAYWPEFASNGKEPITVRQLLTHYSGLRPDLSLSPHWSGYGPGMEMILSERPVCPPGSRFIYSDINFQILGELVRRMTGLGLEDYASQHIFGPLGMKDTLFTPPQELCSRIAPTQPRKTEGTKPCGAVHDPTAFRLGGAAGNAGLFSTADDLSVFAQMLLHKGSFRGARILEPATVELMTAPQSPAGREKLRGLGWDIRPAFGSNRDELPAFGSIGHTGYTGTELRIDPVSGTYYIILTNRVHMGKKGDAGKLRTAVADLIYHSTGKAVGKLQPDRIIRRPEAGVITGIDVLKEEDFSSLAGLRIGLITNHTGRDASGRRTLDLLRQAKTFRLTALFTPEHGLSGEKDEYLRSSTDPATGLPVHSLYGRVKRPTEKMLQDIDALVFDIQDAGVRFYTYISTMGYALEAAAARGIPFYVLDRPNPITALSVQGPVLDSDLRSFTAYFPLPVRHGMTVGELASLFNKENSINADLRVVKMKGYSRTDWYDETGLTWVNPSPNLRSMTGAVLYPGVALLEGANVSVGRGTETPFELVGAPWIDPEKLSSFLAGRSISGVRFVPVAFTPKSSTYEKKPCRGVRVVLEDRNLLDPVLLGIEMVSALRKLYPDVFQIDRILGLIGSRDVLKRLKDGTDPSSIALLWQDRLEEFNTMRSKYLLY
ncbi:MAG: DUF1343 domain-containing protein [Nitrospirae bacterium]|nr:MAG: DUF1343 domain-containing protein [Nitrospirota bacterium]